jgi:hypothetical protein
MPPLMKLSDTAIKNAKPKDKIFKLFDDGGLYLEVSIWKSLSKDIQYWLQKYRCQ